MTRKEDLEQLITQSYHLARDYEIIEQTSSDPKELARARKYIQDQKDLLRKYLQEYITLSKLISFLISNEILEIVAFTEIRTTDKYVTGDDEVLHTKKSLQQQLSNLIKDLLVIQEKQSEFIDPRSIPPDLLVAEDLLREKIFLIETRLRNLGKT